MEQIQQYIKQLQGILGVLSLESILDVIQRLHEARLSEQQVFVMGNGVTSPLIIAHRISW
jgi:hypothetical protein